MIKLTKLFFALSLLVFLSACGGDDEPALTEASIIGTWKAVSFTADVASTAEVFGTATTTTSSIEGSNFDYEVTFDDTKFMTNGSYDISYSISVNGADFPVPDQEVRDISGDGTYSVDGNTMTINGAFYEFEANGIDYSALDEGQTVEYEINGNGELIITQDEEIKVNQGGVTSTTNIVSKSVWVKQ